jgi:hypothetical protein
MAKKTYSDSIQITTPNLSLEIDKTTGRLSATCSASASFIAYTVGSYSTTTTASVDNNCILVNANSTTLTLPTSPPNGLFLIIRKTNSVSADQTTTISGTPSSIKMMFTGSSISTPTPVTSFKMTSNGSYMFVHYNGTWYGL